MGEATIGLRCSQWTFLLLEVGLLWIQAEAFNPLVRRMAVWYPCEQGMATQRIKTSTRQLNSKLPHSTFPQSWGYTLSSSATKPCTEMWLYTNNSITSAHVCPPPSPTPPHPHLSIQLLYVAVLYLHFRFSFSTTVPSTSNTHSCGQERKFQHPGQIPQVCRNWFSSWRPPWVSETHGGPSMSPRLSLPHEWRPLPEAWWGASRTH